MIRTKKTLETLHKNTVAKIQEHENQVHEISMRIQELEDKIRLAPTKLEEIRYLDEKIEAQEQLSSLEKSVNMSDYYAKTADIMNQYYSAPQATKEVRSVLDLLAKPAEQQEEEEQEGDLFTNYMSIVDPEGLAKKKISRESSKKRTVKYKCQECGSNEMCVMNTEGYILCMNCNMVEKFIIDHDKPSYKDPPKEMVHNCYKRSNHLNECINHIQGKEHTDIPDEVINRILYELKKQRVTNLATLDSEFMFKLLKKINLSVYYDHIPYIICALNGCKNPTLDPVVNEKINSMFKQVHEIFTKHIPRSRTNMLSYPYLLCKFFELLGQDHMLKNVRMLKTQKLKEQDAIWKNICMDCQWEFIPSIVY